METEYVKIEINELANLIKKADELDALECGGVDNWEWYGESLSENFDEETDYYEYVSTHYDKINEKENNK